MWFSTPQPAHLASKAEYRCSHAELRPSPGPSGFTISSSIVGVMDKIGTTIKYGKKCRPSNTCSTRAIWQGQVPIQYSTVQARRRLFYVQLRLKSKRSPPKTQYEVERGARSRERTTVTAKVTAMMFTRSLIAVLYCTVSENYPKNHCLIQYLRLLITNTWKS